MKYLFFAICSPVRSLIIIALVLSTMCSAVTVSTAGIIGWVSLVIPNILRKIVGVRHFILLPFSAIVGASFLLIADTLSRSVSTVEIPIGVVTGIIGAPIFIIIMAKKLIMNYYIFSILIHFIEPEILSFPVDVLTTS